VNSHCRIWSVAAILISRVAARLQLGLALEMQKLLVVHARCAPVSIMISSILMTSSFVLQASTPYRHGLSSGGTGWRVVLSQAREAYEVAIERGAHTAILVELAESEALVQEAHTARPQAKLGDLLGGLQDPGGLS